MTAALVPIARASHEPAELHGERWRLETEKEWLVEGAPEALDAVADAAPDLCERLARGVLLLSFRNAVGRLRLPHVGELELVSGKWSETDFDRLLREITDVAAGLPFSRRLGSGLPYERALVPERAVSYYAFVYLRYILAETTPAEDRLDLALHEILRRPHRRLVASEHIVPIDRARSVMDRGLLGILEKPWRWQPAGSSYPLATALRGHLPDRVDVDQRKETIDTPENRFVLAVIDQCRDIVEESARRVAAWNQPALRDRVLRDCAGMRQTLGSVRAHGMWADVGPMTHVPAGSSVLQRRLGYREVLHHFVKLRLVSRIPLDDQAVHDLLATKDIATLYELWTFFALIDAVRRILGPPSTAEIPVESEGQLAVRHGYRIAWPDGTLALYNASFSRGHSLRSTSVQLRPDITLRVPSGPNRGLHLFDAKFRLEALASESEDASTFKRADIYKMHAYRDAIPEAASVWILYPGDARRFFPAHDAPDGRIEGVGALPARPAATQLIGTLRDLFDVHPKNPTETGRSQCRFS